MEKGTEDTSEHMIPVIDLRAAPGERQSWGKPAAIVYIWAIVEYLILTNPIQISSILRVRVLRLFGAKIGDDVIFRPRTRVKFPWKLEIGDRSWIGEGVWIHNQDYVVVGHDVVISQDTFITTGSHAVRKNMALVTRPIHIEAGVWVTSKSVILGGVRLGRNCVVKVGSVVGPNVTIPSNRIVGFSGALKDFGDRFRQE